MPGDALPQGYSVRGATWDDFDRVVELSRAADMADWGAIDFSAEFLRHEWSFPQLDLAADTWVIEHSVQACGYAWLLARDEHREMDGWGVVHPDHRGCGLGSSILDLIDARAE